MFVMSNSTSQAHISHSGEQGGTECLPINKQGVPALFEKDAKKVASILDLTSTALCKTLASKLHSPAIVLASKSGTKSP